MKQIQVVFLLSVLLISCNPRIGQRVQVENIKQKYQYIETLLKKEGIEYIKQDFGNAINWTVGLGGEKISKEVVFTYSPYYTIDWEREKALPNFYYKDIPLKEPRLLTNKKGELQIFVAEVGNNKKKDERELDIFDNDQIINLRTHLDNLFGRAVLVSEEGFMDIHNMGNVYRWIDGNNTILLTIKNEFFQEVEVVGAWTRIRKGFDEGIHGDLKIYYNSKPEFFIEKYNYPR